jgi:hypothetical protein
MAGRYPSFNNKKLEKKDYGDFKEEIQDKIAKIHIQQHPLVIGIIKEVRSHWIKVECNDKRVLYINKTRILSIEPIGKA